MIEFNTKENKAKAFRRLFLNPIYNIQMAALLAFLFGTGLYSYGLDIFISILKFSNVIGSMPPGGRCFYIYPFMVFCQALFLVGEIYSIQRGRGLRLNKKLPPWKVLRINLIFYLGLLVIFWIGLDYIDKWGSVCMAKLAGPSEKLGLSVKDIYNLISSGFILLFPFRLIPSFIWEWDIPLKNKGAYDAN